MQHLQSALGIVALIAFAWAISENRRMVSLRRIGVGLAVAVVLAVVRARDLDELGTEGRDGLRPHDPVPVDAYRPLLESLGRRVDVSRPRTARVDRGGRSACVALGLEEQEVDDVAWQRQIRTHHLEPPERELVRVLRCLARPPVGAVPPEEPPGVKRVFHGLRVTPNTSLYVLPPAANSGIFVLPTTSAPRASRRCTTMSDSGDTRSAKIVEPIVQRTPSTWTLSLTAIGSP